MSIGRARKFVALIYKEWSELQAYLSSSEIQETTFESMIVDEGGKLFEIVTRLFNYVFEYRNDGYESVESEWLEENLPIRGVKMIGEELLVQNQLGGLRGFFGKLGHQLSEAIDQLISSLSIGTV